MANILTLPAMRDYLRRSITSKNKLKGLLAEVDFRQYLNSLDFGKRVSPGGWIARGVGPGVFGHNTVVFFPELLMTDKDYSKNRQMPDPPHGLHTICATFHQIGIVSYYCTPSMVSGDQSVELEWSAVQLGLPTRGEYLPFPDLISGFSERERRYNFLRWKTDVKMIPDESVTEEFAKEHLRVAFQNNYMAEISDVDGILWGKQHTYPVEIKEKTVAFDKKVGDYFGLDLGPFAKLAYYAAKRGNLHSLFVVREIVDVESRNLVTWWAIKFDRLAQFASWVPISGGRGMSGGVSSVVKIPKAEFSELNKEFLGSL